MKVLTTDEISGTQYLKEVAFDLPQFYIDDLIGYYKDDEGSPIESRVVSIEMMMFKNDESIVTAYQYELKNGTILNEDEIAYVL